MNDIRLRRAEDHGPVGWAVLPDRSTQHAVVVSTESVVQSGRVLNQKVAWFECMNRMVSISKLLLRSSPWPRDEAILCKRHWCQNHWGEQVSLSDADRARMREALLKIENELAEPGALS